MSSRKSQPDTEGTATAKIPTTAQRDSARSIDSARTRENDRNGVS
jgi:hypothetical protein